ncbi:hypothetical protein [Actinomadura chibensis]|uniref:Uncharacterized protein n=1 Tax=Actinomadura chibensis TaxID=392828 RepID=A0A5D0NAK0_9ACTN|nr:hypothetical protein [Actinomadura chibensis]TYB41359.1 hypothetical protein FXF69_35060 [Actinomadura chibensis]
MTGGFSPRGAPAGRWTLVRDGHRLEVETARVGWYRAVRLFVDGEPAGDATTDAMKAELPYGEMSVAVAFDLLGLVDGQAARCDLVPADHSEASDDGEDDESDPDGGRVAFEPGAGTRAARREALARAHPVLYASRHVAAATAKVLFPLLGLGALVRVLLRAVPWPDVRLPDVDAPSIPWPDVPWPGLPDLPDLPEVSAPPWLAPVLAAAKFAVPILIAVAVAAREARRRKRTPPPPAEDPPPATGATTPEAPGARTGRDGGGS